LEARFLTSVANCSSATLKASSIVS
jgi:hypothetical protein